MENYEECLDRLYNLKLMESMEYKDYEILRVPGGWNFTRLDKHYLYGELKNGSQSSVFVPYQRKMMKPKP